MNTGIFVFRSEGDADLVESYDAFLLEHAEHWLVREVVLYWKRVLKRIDMTSRTMIALVEPGSCFSGFLAEIVLASDRAYMLEGARDAGGAGAALELTGSNTGPLPMANDLTRLEARFWGDESALEAATSVVGERLDAREALAVGVVTDVMDDVDWDDEIRIILEERSSFSPDALTAMEANLRFPGPETMETKIFGRLTAWQNWVFQRPNASGEAGALRSYGTGRRPKYDTRRV
jgi:benzoyl-CoA-dihydrodiol lyase